MSESARAPLSPHPVGEALFDELLWVHGAIKRDLGRVRELATRVVGGLEATEVRAEIDALQSTSPLWRLKMTCLAYCRFVHDHHELEDVALFPALRRTNPAIGEQVDRLERDHRRVADYLADVERASADLLVDDSASARERLAESLDALGSHLLAHLSFEEESIGPTMRSWDRDPLDAACEASQDSSTACRGHHP